MVKKRGPSPGAATAAGSISAPRSNRLYRLLSILAATPQTRAVLLRRLSLDVRGFYRDLELLRRLGVAVTLREGRYVLTGTLDDALERLPFPDPKLNLREAILLGQGGTAAHEKLRAVVETITGAPTRRRTRG